MYKTMNRHQVASMLGVSISTLARLRKHYGLPAVQVGRSVRFRVDRVLDFLERHSV